MGHFFKFKKGSPEARAHMAKIRGMRGKKRKKNPLTRTEAGRELRQAKADSQTASKYDDYRKDFFGGMAVGISQSVHRRGPKSARRAAIKVSKAAERAVGISEARRGNP